MNNSAQTQQQYRTRINAYIKVPQIRLILSNGENGGVVNTKDALKCAQDEGLDLIEINPRAAPPVCKIADFGKMKYEEKKKTQAAKKNQVNQELKELTIRPNTDDGDLSHKLEKAKEFLSNGDRVKFTVRFRGREVVHSNIGRERLEWFLTQLETMIVSNPPINLEGKFMSTIVSPLKK